MSQELLSELLPYCYAKVDTPTVSYEVDGVMYAIPCYSRLGRIPVFITAFEEMKEKGVLIFLFGAENAPLFGDSCAIVRFASFDPITKEMNV